MIGREFSHYRILEELGRGGMGVVYKAQDTRLDRIVALKFLPPDVRASEQEKTRFMQEAKAAAALNHPNICSVIDVEEDGGAAKNGADKQIFIVMEFVDGQTLQEKKGSLSLKQAIDTGIQVADALAAAHEKGIIHRDIKPENIMVRKDGIVQIMDFGLAKLRETQVSRLTREGSTVGTAGYMSPEQVQGQDVDHRSDIFSLGVLLYELITGQLPFKSVHETALLYEIANVDPPSMASMKPDVDPELDRIVMECLEKDPSERYQSAAEVAKDLRRVRRETSRHHLSRTMPAAGPAPSIGPEVAASGGKRTFTQRIWLPAVSGLLVLAIVALAWSVWRSDRNTVQPVIRFSFTMPFSLVQGQGASPLAISPDGKYIAWVGGQGVVSQVFLRRLDQLSLQPLPRTDGALDPFFSPDGQWIAAQVGGKLKKFSVFGGTPQDVCDIQGLIRGGWWAPDNTIFFGSIATGIMQVSANGGTPQLVTTLDSASGEISDRFPQLLPDGKTILFTVKQSNLSTFDEATIAAQRLGSSDRKILIHGGTSARYLPDGHLMYARGNTLFAVPFDPKKLEITGPPVPLFEGGMLNEFSGSAVYGFSNTGILAYAASDPVSYDRLVVGWMDARGSISSLLDTPKPYADGALSPDGEKLAMTIQAANDDIWVYQIRRGTLTRLTFEGGNHSSPIWSPDGKYIYYSAEHGRSANIYRKLGDGSGREERMTQSPEAQSSSSCSPDGKMLAFIQDADIWMLPLGEDQRPRPFIQSPADEEGAVFSPDGRWIAYTSNESGQPEVFVVPFPGPGGKWQISSGGGVQPRWSRDGHELYYLSRTQLMAASVVLQPTFGFSTPRKLCDIPANTSNFIDVDPAGKRFVVTLSKLQDTMVTQVNVVVGWFQELKEKFEGTKQ